MQSPTKYKQILPHMCVNNKHVHNSSNYPPKLLFITQEMNLGENLLQNPKSQRMEDGQERERERENGKSSSITIVQNMVKKKVRRGIYLYLERQTYLSWINAKCPPPSIRGDPKGRAHHLGFVRYI